MKPVTLQCLDAYSQTRIKVTVLKKNCYTTVVGDLLISSHCYVGTYMVIHANLAMLLNESEF